MDGERGPKAAPPGEALNSQATTPSQGAPRAGALYVWKSPRPSDPAGAEALLRDVFAARSAEASSGEAEHASAPAGPAPTSGPFVASDDVGWFYRELTGDKPPLWNPDAPPKHGPPPSHLVVVPLPPDSIQETLEDVYSLGLKYDLVVYDPQRRTLHAPMAEMSAHASATFWPRGAIQAAIAGGAGAVIAVIAWFVGIPIISGVAMVVGAFLFGMAVLTFVIEGRKRTRRQSDEGANAGPGRASGGAGPEV